MFVVDLWLFVTIGKSFIETPQVSESSEGLCSLNYCPLIEPVEAVGGAEDDELPTFRIAAQTASSLEPSPTAPTEPIESSLPFLPPTPCQKITQEYWSKHRAIDIIPPCQNYNIFSSQAGKVIFVGVNGPYGNQIVIEHENGWKTTYSHLKSFAVEEGEEVIRQQLLGVMGTTGQSTGVHLHFEIISPDGVKRNPLDYIAP